MSPIETAFPVIDLVETGRCIARRRRQAGLTVRDLQTYFGFEYPQAIYKWQRRECLPTVDNLLVLARLLQMPMEVLLIYEDQGISHILYRNLNHRFNDKLFFNGYHRNTEGERNGSFRRSQAENRLQVRTGFSIG